MTVWDREPERLIGDSRSIVFISSHNTFPVVSVDEDSKSSRSRPVLLGIRKLVLRVLLFGGEGRRSSDDVGELRVVFGVEEVLRVSSPSVEREHHGAEEERRSERRVSC